LFYVVEFHYLFSASGIFGLHAQPENSGSAHSADKPGSAYSACMLSPKTPALHILPTNPAPHILPAAFAPARRKPRCIAVGFSFLTFAMQRYYFL